MAPGRSRGIGGCARAPYVFLAAADGTARGYGWVRGGKPVLLPSGGNPGSGIRVRAGGGIGVGNRLRRAKAYLSFPPKAYLLRPSKRCLQQTGRLRYPRQWTTKPESARDSESRFVEVRPPVHQPRTVPPRDAKRFRDAKLP